MAGCNRFQYNLGMNGSVQIHKIKNGAKQIETNKKENKANKTRNGFNIFFFGFFLFLIFIIFPIENNSLI